MRILFIMAGMLLAALALAQPDLLPPPPPNGAQQAPELVELMQAADAAITTLAQNTLASKRLKKITEEGLIVASFTPLMPDGGDDAFTVLVVSWMQEKMTNAMIREDAGGHFAVIDRASIDKAIREMKLDAKALADPKNWPAIGQAAGAKYMVTGFIGILPLAEHPLSLSFSLTARVVSVADGKAVAAGSVDFIFPETK